MKRPYFHYKAGIYIIICRANLKMYIGSSCNLKNRFADHVSHLTHKKHINAHLQSAWNQYGSEQFMFGILEYCEGDNQKLLSLEQDYLNRYKPYKREIGFNIMPLAERAVGAIAEESRKKMSLAKLGHTKSEKTVQLHKDNWEKHGKEWAAQQIKDYGKSFRIVSPDGILYEGRGIRLFARQHGLNRTDLSRVISGYGKNKSTKGWHLPETVSREPYRIIDPNGNEYTIPFGEMSKFSLERGLNPARLGRLAIGSLAKYRGWKRKTV